MNVFASVGDVFIWASAVAALVRREASTAEAAAQRAICRCADQVRCRIYLSFLRAQHDFFMGAIHELAPALRRRRSGMGLTQLRVAVLSGVSRQTVNQIEICAAPDLGVTNECLSGIHLGEDG